MKVYFYHTQNIQYCLGRMAKGEFPSHFLYGACHLADNGIDVVWHRSPRHDMPRLKTALYTAWRILTCREGFDAIYATHYKGLEIIVFLRALGLYRKPIVVWHHQPVVDSPSRLRQWAGRLFYRGLDRMIFFSKKLADDSRKAHKADPTRFVVGHWGADLDFYDKIREERRVKNEEPTCDDRFTFIATGKEQRDQPTLIEAFNRSGLNLRLYIGINPNPNVPNPNLEAVERCHPGKNIDVVKICGLLPYEIALDVAAAQCVAVCCHRTRYTAGLTTVVEALALGLPMICSRNPQIPIDFEADGCGIAVDYGDTLGWQRAAEWMAAHPDEARRMGQRGRTLAECLFNDRRNAREMADIIRACLIRTSRQV